MMYTLGQACAYAGRLHDAQEAIEIALKIDPDYVPAIARLATIMQYQGSTDDAVKTIDAAHARGLDAWELDHTLGELAPKIGRVDEAVDRIKPRLADSTIQGSARVELGFNLASLLERQKDYTGAWKAATDANKYKTDGGMGGYTIKGGKGPKADTRITGYKKRVEHTMELFTVDLLKALEPTEKGPKSVDQMLMISGMPRSGTTLLEQILSAHPLAESAGEAPYLIMASNDLKMNDSPTEQHLMRMSVSKRSKAAADVMKQLRAITGDSEYVVDKHPANDEHIGLLAAIAPGSKMILTRRDPRDVALSCFFRNFALGHGWTNKFESIVDMIEVRLLMHEHWLKVIPEGAPWLGLRVGDYEGIVSDPETQTRKIVEFAGLPWDDACLKFSERKRIVPTLQPHQAAQGVYKGSVAKWAPYAECMGESLDRLNAICERHGYPV